MRMLLLSLTVVFASVALPSASSAASARNPLARLLAQQGNTYLCFRRVYDEAHLRRHPGQRATLVLVSLDHGKDTTGQAVWLKLRLRQKGRSSPADVAASCEWSAKANANTSGSRLIPAYPRNDGFACIAMYDNQASVEAGTLMFDLTPDGRGVTVYFHDEGIGLWGTAPEHTIFDEKTRDWRTIPGDPSLNLGREDRVFRLARADPAACRDMEQAIDLSKD
jgi:hypothetical protein